MQRVALGRAMVRQPEVYLMDEPLSNLDAQLRVEMRGEIKRLQRELGVTTIYVTHDQAEAMTMADTLLVLRNGKIEQAGDPEAIYRHPATAFVAGFIGSPMINLIDGRLDGEGGAFAAGAARIPLPGELRQAAAGQGQRPLLLGIRPEDVVVSQESEAGQPACAGRGARAAGQGGAAAAGRRFPADRQPAARHHPARPAPGARRDGLAALPAGAAAFVRWGEWGCGRMVETDSQK